MRRLGAVVLTMLCAVPVLEAQSAHQQVRHGFWISAGLGAGIYDLSCDGCSYDVAIDKSGNLRMGGTVSQKVLVGGEMMAWAHYENGVDEWAGGLTAVVLYYPSATGGLFLSGGLGIAGYDASGYGWERSVTAFALSGGVGYDLRLASSFSITPFFNGFYGTKASLEFPGTQTGAEVSQSLLQLGLAITFH